MSAGLYDQCADQDNNQDNGQQQGEEFDLKEAMECRRLEIDEQAAQYYGGYGNNANANYYNGNNMNQNVEFFVGPHCSANGKSIYLGVFMDETCSFTAPDGIYEKTHYGKSLPYSSTSIISHDCISCKEVVEQDEDENADNNNGDNQQEEANVLEVCERLYEPAGKCETNLNLYGRYPNTLACNFIGGLNSWGKTRIAATFAEAKKNVTPSVLAGVFAATTVLFAGVVYHLNQRLQRSNVGLVSGNGDMA